MGNEQMPRRRGRPPLPMPDPIPDTMENVARALLTTPPKREDEWEYIQEHKARHDSGRKPTRAERRRGEREARKSKATDFVSGTCPNGRPEQARRGCCTASRRPNARDAAKPRDSRRCPNEGFPRAIRRV